MQKLSLMTLEKGTPRQRLKIAPLIIIKNVPAFNKDNKHV